ncbi:hypothetical protein AMK16_30325 [Streptomyces sp. CB00455]|nr:hypothetical protein AMK16_30325 [Streptomyces sp. CB00455]
MAAAGGVLAMGGGAAHADSIAAGQAANSPGLLSGNTVQAPIDVPVNACGNTVTVVGGLNPAFGNRCANVSGHGGHQTGTPGHPGHPGTPGHPGNPGHPGTPGGHHPGTPGGDHPGHPGNPGHPGDGDEPCDDHPGHPGGGDHPGHPGTPGNPGTPGGHTPGKPTTPGPATGTVTPVTHPAPAPGTPATPPVLAATGSNGVLTAGLPLAGGLLLGGAVLYRRARNAA